MYKRSYVLSLVTLQLLFLIIFTIAFVNHVQGTPVLGTALDVNVENWIIMIFSVVSMVNTVYELSKVS